MKLLEIVRRSQDLVAHKQKEEKRLQSIIEELKAGNLEIMAALKQDRMDKFADIISKYTKLLDDVDDDKKKMSGIEQEAQLEEKIHRVRIEEQLNRQLEDAQQEE